MERGRKEGDVRNEERKRQKERNWRRANNNMENKNVWGQYQINMIPSCKDHTENTPSKSSLATAASAGFTILVCSRHTTICYEMNHSNEVKEPLCMLTKWERWVHFQAISRMKVTLK
jgi:hypothetical protein